MRPVGFRFLAVSVLMALAMAAGAVVVSQDTTSSVSSEPSRKKILGLWGELYDESTSFEQNDYNLVSLSHIRQGVRISAIPGVGLETYLLLRYGKDWRRDFWNNRVEGGIGLRARFSLPVFLALYMEGIWGNYLDIPEEDSESVEKSYRDLRAGLLFWYGWDKNSPDGRFFSLPLKTWGDLYGDASYYREENHNTIAYFHAKIGFGLIRFWKSGLDGYGVVYLMKDINRDFWNNKAEIGPGLWFRPLLDLDLKIFAEWIQGAYYGIEGDDPNPYPRQYHDMRVGILFWIGW